MIKRSITQDFMLALIETLIKSGFDFLLGVYNTNAVAKKIQSAFFSVIWLTVG